ncbi:MAG: response regulator transcription factor [Thermoanaerobacterales bacterium]|nr:response regulator transcription factor [Bacillota bacterium]MDI6905873.1 response regulator transcription factor [Thermoanaerobacterales bacterium]
MLILVIDDEPHILELVRFNLEKEGFETALAADGLQGLEMARGLKPDLVILDLMLPEMDGYQVCRELRSDPQLTGVPVIMLTARDQELDKVLGFELGADDYVTKPFSPRELLARVKAQLRRRTAAALPAERRPESEIRIADLVIRPSRFEVEVRGEPVRLSRKEFNLLLLMASHPGQVFTRDQLLERIWGYDAVDGTRTVDVHVRYLRRKIEEDPAHPRYIETVRGLGYRMKG